MLDIEDYKNSIASLSEKTILNYVCSAKKFSTWIGESVITQSNIDAYIGFLKERASTEASFRSSIIQLSSIIKWLNNRGYNLTVPKIPVAKTTVPTIITAQEYALLIRQMRRPHLKMAVSFLYRLGLRCGEVLNLRWEDIDKEKGVLVVHRKGGNEQVLPYRSTKTEDLHSLVDSFNLVSGWVISTDGGKSHISRQSLQGSVKSASERAGIKYVNLHSLRHGFAHNAVYRGIPGPIIQKFMGHSSLATTESYLRTVGSDINILMKGIE